MSVEQFHPTDKAFYQTAIKQVLDILNDFNDKERKIFIMRLIEGKTLEIVGNELGFTRERARQIECKIIKKLRIKQRSDKLHAMDTIIESMIINSGHDYITYEDYVSLVGDKAVASVGFSLFNIMINEEIKYSEKLSIFYDSKYFNIEEFEKNTLNKLGNFISFSKYDSLEDFQKQIVNANYAKKPFGYIFRGLPKRELILNFLDRYFPNGYKYYSDEDFKKFSELFAAEFGNYYSIGKREIQTAITNGNFICISKGTYANHSNAIKIPDELVEKILNYLSNSSGKVFYKTIFSEFKNEFIEIGISNPYFMKAMVDEAIGDTVLTSRDHLALNEEDMKKDNVTEYFLKSETPVSIERLKSVFPGMPESLFYFKLLAAKEMILLSDKRYLNANYISITDEEKKIIKATIDKWISKSDLGVASSRSIFPMFEFYNKELISNLEYINDYVSFFSYAQYLFKDDYEFSRPFICAKGERINSIHEIALKHFGEYEKFTFNDVVLYLKKYDTFINNKVLYINDMAKQFVFDGVETFYRKRSLPANILLNIKQLISNFINTFGCIDSSKFNGYELFQNISKMIWNKFSLFSVATAFFKNEFDIEIVDVNLETFRFVIRRKENE